MNIYFDTYKIEEKGVLFSNREELIKRLNELKEISEETGVSLENVIHYVGYGIIANTLENVYESHEKTSEDA